MLIQATTVSLVRDSTKSYTLGIYTALSSAVLIVVLLVEDAILSQQRSDIGPPAPFSLRIVQFAVTISVLFAGITLPRRPVVFLDGVPVDGMYTVSALGRYSFAWVEHLLVLANKVKVCDHFSN